MNTSQQAGELSLVELERLHGSPLIELRCPNCKTTIQWKIKNHKPFLSECPSCKRYLVGTWFVVKKPGAIKIEVKLQTLVKPKIDDKSKSEKSNSNIRSIP